MNLPFKAYLFAALIWQYYPYQIPILWNKRQPIEPISVGLICRGKCESILVVIIKGDVVSATSSPFLFISMDWLNFKGNNFTSSNWFFFKVTLCTLMKHMISDVLQILKLTKKTFIPIQNQLHLSKDSHIVLHHDVFLSQNTDGTGYISSLTLEGLKYVIVLLTHSHNSKEVLDEFISVPQLVDINSKCCQANIWCKSNSICWKFI